MKVEHTSVEQRHVHVNAAEVGGDKCFTSSFGGQEITNGLSIGALLTEHGLITRLFQLRSGSFAVFFAGYYKLSRLMQCEIFVGRVGAATLQDGTRGTRGVGDEGVSTCTRDGYPTGGQGAYCSREAETARGTKVVSSAPIGSQEFFGARRRSLGLGICGAAMVFVFGRWRSAPGRMRSLMEGGMGARG